MLHYNTLEKTVLVDNQTGYHIIQYHILSRIILSFSRIQDLYVRVVNSTAACRRCPGANISSEKVLAELAEKKLGEALSTCLRCQD